MIEFSHTRMGTHIKVTTDDAGAKALLASIIPRSDQHCVRENFRETYGQPTAETWWISKDIANTLGADIR